MNIRVAPHVVTPFTLYSPCGETNLQMDVEKQKYGLNLFSK